MENTSPETMARESAEKTAARLAQASASAHDMVDRAADVAIGATQRVSASSAELAAGATRLAEATRERVRRNPIASLGVVVGAALGMVLAAGLWFQRRERWTDHHTHAH